MKKEKILLKDGTEVEGDNFDKKDFLLLQEIFKEWLSINAKLKQLGGRNLNVPDAFSEAIFCMTFGALRTNNTAYSYDCVMKKTGEGVQVKSASIQQDCTSFGPTSTWDLLYFVDFVPNGVIEDGDIDIYQINSDYVYNLVLNAKKHETFRDQQKQGRRPRFSIHASIIDKKHLKPVKSVNILTGKGFKLK